MNKRGLLFMIPLAIAAMTAIFLASPEAASADASDSGQMVIVVGDWAAIWGSEEDEFLVRSFFGLLATLQADQKLAFINTEDASDVIGPLGDDFDLAAVISRIEGRLPPSAITRRRSIANAVAEAQAVLGSERAAAGSDVYLVIGSPPAIELESQLSRITPLLSRFRDKGWRINGIAIPGTSDESLGFLQKVSTAARGQVFEASIPGGYRELADSILGKAARGALSPLGWKVLERSDLMTSILSIAPGTRETTVLIFKESPFGSLRLSNPGGFETSAGDRTSSTVVETPYLVTWTLTDPAPGNWQIDARGIDGLVSVWAHSTNRYRLVLSALTPMPLNQPTTILGHVTDGEQPVAMEDVRLYAKVSTPDGTAAVYEMNDKGLDGDAVRDDGYYSAALPPLRAEGTYAVELELSWPDFNHRISSLSSFSTQAFPMIEVEPVQFDDLRTGERTRIAMVYVHVQGEPYSIGADQLTGIIGTATNRELVAGLAEPQQDPYLTAQTEQAPGEALPPSPERDGVLELEPRRLFGDGPVWEYEVYFTPATDGFHTVGFELNLEYAGIEYAHASEALVLHSVGPQTPLEAVRDVPSAPVALAATAALQPSPAPADEPPSFPWGAVFGLGIIAVAAAALVVYLVTRGRPRGYLYNDRDEPVVDFSTVERHPLMAFFLRNWVRGSELRVPELNGVVFRFSRSRISLRSVGKHQTIRVNNQPLIKDVTLRDKTWIGTGGKLFTFLLSPMAAPGTASAD